MFNPYLRLQVSIDMFKVSMDYYGYAAMMIKKPTAYQR